MAKYNRTQSQTILFVVSIIDIVFGVIAIVAAFLSFVGVAAVGAATASNELAASGVTAADAGVASAAIGILGIIALLGGVLSVVEGVLGIRAANDNQKIMPVWILAIISLAMTIFSCISSIVQGSFSFSMIVSLALAGVMFWVANNIKQEAGR